MFPISSSEDVIVVRWEEGKRSSVGQKRREVAAWRCGRTPVPISSDAARPETPQHVSQDSRLRSGQGCSLPTLGTWRSGLPSCFQGDSSVLSQIFEHESTGTSRTRLADVFWRLVETKLPCCSTFAAPGIRGNILGGWLAALLTVRGDVRFRYNLNVTVCRTIGRQHQISSTSCPYNVSTSVAIIGAGPAGCMLARLLHLKGVSVTVFESEASPNYRSQGGSLDLHSSTGMAAMKEADLWTEFEKHARYDGQYLAMTNRNLKYLFVRGASDKIAKVMDERPEIDRAKLRQILTESLPHDMIRWDHKLLHVQDNGMLIFKNGIESKFDLVVGAEGAWSKVRTFLAPDLQPVYAGVGMYDLQIPDAETTAPDVYRLVNRGSVFAGSEGQRMTIQQLGSGAVNVYAFQRYDRPDWMEANNCGYDSSQLSEVKGKLRAVLQATQGSCTPRSVYVLPTGQRWSHKPGFTLIGDAAHLMTSFAGEGVNQALEDALCLSHVIVAAATEGRDLDSGIKQFEDDMITRTTKLQQLSLDLVHDWMFTPDAPDSIMPRVLARHLNAHLPWFLHPFTSAGLHAYYYIANWF
ncbi:hypothetical protein NLU13_5148 [Sarocladium strictum]|uniref:FAD-binding domain-containing protein n=1 Tax=Sarocladium strictum TaxID=5046 RepID=A0AA39GGC4_SARSR|nr:hypothetical protein NLU13_5148 [Sarocladium strictum]